MTISFMTTRSSSCRLTSSGASMRSTPPECRMSKRNSDSGTAAASASLAARAAVCWKGSGLPSRRSAISSPSKTADSTGSARAAATTSGSRNVMSSSVRVNRRTCPPAMWTWTRIPSSFHSMAACPPVLDRAPAIVGSLAASMGFSGWKTWRPKEARASVPPVSAAHAARGSDPLSMAARRTCAAAVAAAFATASVITPSSAPCRSSPASSRTRKYCSPAVARRRSSPIRRLRSAAAPLPVVKPIWRNAASTSATVIVATSAGGGTARSVAQPTPICRWGSSPDR